jgi:molybdenum cofactor guanylyltransferase
MSTPGQVPPVYGLVLAGGRSTRMGQDKAALTYGGDRPQLERAMSLLQPLVARAYISVRAEQANDPLRARFAQILDQHINMGPIAGLLSAQEQHPQAAWLVLACDLPLLDESTLKHLLQARDPRRVATAYRSSHDGLPEPLCAIYEPRSRAPLGAHLASGKLCPRKFLSSNDTLLLDQPNPRALDNINTPQEYDSAAPRVREAATPDADKHLTVQYYALLREQSGRREETLTTRAATAAALYEELRERYPFTLPATVLRVAVNSEFRDWHTPLAAGDTVVFIPPVAGG